MEKEDEHYPEPPLNDSERAGLRILLAMKSDLVEMNEEEKMRKWFYANARRWAAAVLAIVTALVAFRNDISSILSWFSQGPRP
jgi:hypothetical protein